MNISRAELRTWVDSCMREGHRGDDCKVIACLHVKDDRKVVPVDAVDVKPDTPLEKTVDDLIKMAEGDAEGAKATQEYLYAGYFGENRGDNWSYGRRKRVYVHPQPDDDEGEDERSEAPTARGERAQSMRIVDGVVKAAVPWANVLMRNLMETNKEQAIRIKELEEERSGMVRLQDEMMNNQHLRNLDLRKTLFWEDKKERAFEGLMGYVPIVFQTLVKKYGGPKVMKEHPEMMIEGIKGFLKSLKPDQLEGMMRPLDTIQQATLASAIDFIMIAEEKDKEKEKERIAKVDEKLGQKDTSEPFTPMTVLKGTAIEMFLTEKEAKEQADKAKAAEDTKPKDD